MDQVNARRNGEYTCLDCLRQCTDKCFKCSNWNRFELDEKVIALPYKERSKRNERKREKWTAKKLRETLEKDSGIT